MLGTCLIAGVVVLATAVASYLMKVRMFVASERGLAELRIRAFRHVHDLPVLTQSSERRGGLVSRVTSDIDQVSMFLQFGGILIVVSVGQMLVATAVMLFYSWQLTLVVWVCFLPLLLALRFVTWRMTAAYGRVRRSVGEMLSVVAEPVVGATVVRAHAIEGRTQARVDAAIQANYRRQVEAQRLVAITFASAGVAGGLASAGVVVVGVWLGVAGQMSIGTVVAFAFLVSLLVGPVQMATQVLTEAQNAVASWRRVIGLLETPADVADPGPGGTPLARGALAGAVRGGHLRVPRRTAGAARHRRRPRRAVAGRGGRRDRLRQDDVRQAADPADGPGIRSGAGGRRRPAEGSVRLAARAGS